MATVINELGTRSAENNTISSVSGAGPTYTVTLSSAPSAGTRIGDTLNDEHATPRLYLITGISGNDLTVRDAFAVASAPDNSGTTQATTTRTHSTMTLWEAALDNTDMYAASDIAHGELADDAAFDESVLINGGGTVGLASWLLAAHPDDRHDGTAGTGARVVRTVAGGNAIIQNDDSVAGVIDFIDFNMNSTNMGRILLVTLIKIRNSIFHDMASGSQTVEGIQTFGSVANDVTNCFIYDIVGTAGSASNAIGLRGAEGAGATVNYMNLTIVTITNNSGTGACFGVQMNDNGTKKAQNVIAMDVTGTTSGSIADFSLSAPSTVVMDHNMSSDTSASGTGSLISKTSSAQFVSTTGGSEDLHLKAGADAIGAGVDLVTTPASVNIDINGFDRDVLATVVWDMGAHQYKILSSIGTTGREFTTITLWEAAHGTTAGSPGSLSQGDVYNDTVFDESVVFNDTAVDDILMTVPVAERHDGTAGTGARIVRTGGGGINKKVLDCTVFAKIEWLEVDVNSQAYECVLNFPAFNAGERNAAKNMIIHDNVGDSSDDVNGIGPSSHDTRAADILNCIFYHIDNTRAATAKTAIGIAATTGTPLNIMNCTIHNINADDSSGEANGLLFTDDVDTTIQNIIVTDVSNGGSGTAQDYNLAAPSLATVDHNIASDTSASGTGSLDSVTSASLYVSTTLGSEDLHLLDTAVAIGAGLVIGSTPAGVDVDIDGTTRGATWDIGADENVLDTPVIVAATANRRTRTLFLFAN